MSDRVIDNMIANVRNRSISAKKRRQEELDNRRHEVLRRIGNAAIDHDLGVVQSARGEDLLHQRLERANKVRISEAEAMADVAESMGDFESGLYWWEIFSSEGFSLWKGYTLYGRRQRIRINALKDGTLFIDPSLGGLQTKWKESNGELFAFEINTRRTSTGGFVSELYLYEDGFGGKSGVMSVGVSEGTKASCEQAVVGAYMAFFSGVEDVDMEMGDVSPELRELARVDNVLTGRSEE